MMRIRVTLNIMKPLHRVLNIEGPNNRAIQVTFAYERLPNFCYFCGLLGHLVKDCLACADMIDEKGRIDETKLEYGEWLHARPIQQENRYIGGSSGRSQHVFITGSSAQVFRQHYSSMLSNERGILSTPVVISGKGKETIRTFLSGNSEVLNDNANSMGSRANLVGKEVNVGKDSVVD